MGEGGSGRSKELEDLIAALDRFCERSTSGGSPDEQAVEVIEFRRVGDRVELEFAKRAAAFAKTDTYEAWGSTTPIDWIRHNCHMSGANAADRVRVGEHLPQLPQSVEAGRCGAIGFAHLSLIARTADALAQSATGQPVDEGPLLEQARQHSVGKFWHLCQHLRHAANPEGVARDQKDAVEARRLRLSPCEDGMVLVGGGSSIPLAPPPCAPPWNRWPGRGGEDDTRNRERRLADALVELATHALDTGEVPDQASQRPHLQVTIPLETLLGLKGAPAAELEFSSPISFKSGARLACDAAINRVVLSADSAVIDVGRARRVVSGATRRALNARDRTCRWPGCDRATS